MRVIAGSAKGRKLKTLEGMEVRPTTDKVKEAVFSSIQFDLPGAEVLDLFSGSGQMGIEPWGESCCFCRSCSKFSSCHARKSGIAAISFRRFASPDGCAFFSTIYGSTV